MFSRIIFVLACLVLPILWGVIVNRLFNFWQGEAEDVADDEPIFPDYQI